MPGISIFFPVYNDEHTIGTLVYETIKTVELLTKVSHALRN